MPIIHKVTPKKTQMEVEAHLKEPVRARLLPSLRAAGFSDFPSELYYVAFKEEKKLEVYGRREDRWQHIKSYPFTATSGQLGPKLKEGDKQIPEGIYQVEYLNPNSSFYLSMKINYPNAFDRAKAKEVGRTDLGSDIFIHGKAVTVGCIPVGDVAIEELYMMTSSVAGRSHKLMILPRDFRKNKVFPEITSVDWGRELYEVLSRELERF